MRVVTRITQGDTITTMTWWFAPQVGMAKSMTDSGTVKSTTELTESKLAAKWRRDGTWPAARRSYRGMNRVFEIWRELWVETLITAAAWREVRALEAFLAQHALDLERLPGGGWAWSDEAIRFRLGWHAPAAWGQPGEIEVAALGPVPLMTLKLTDRDGPVLRSELEDLTRMQRWATDTGARIVAHLVELTGRVPELSAAAHVVRVRVPLVGPLKPLIGAVEALLTAVPQERRARA